MRLSVLLLTLLAFALVRPTPASAQSGRPATCPRSIADADSASASDPVARAIRCAEWFVAQQGFTEQAVTDTAAIIWDFEERAFPAATVLALRRRSLAPEAYGVCSTVNNQSGYTVVFVHPGAGAADSIGRTVWMTRELAEMHVTHQGIYLAPVRAGEFGCRLLTKGFDRRQHN